MCGGRYLVIVSKLSYGQPVIPVVLTLVHEKLKKLLIFLVASLSLTICMGVISCGGHYSDPQKLI